jgi:2-iminobutanoate/2-iminopropanoate deaminase
MMKRCLIARKAARPFTRISHAVRVGNLVFTAGQGPRDPKTGRVIPGDIRIHARQTMENLSAILEVAGSSWDHVVSATVWLSNIIRDFAAFNEVWNEYVHRDYPARAVVQAGKLNAGMKIEIQLVALARSRASRRRSR